MAHKPIKRIVPGAKTAVILCHGIMGSPDHFRHFLPLIPEDWSVCCLLLDGHGKGVMDFAHSSMDKWKAQVFAQLRELMDLRIFVDAEADVRLCRRIQRDVSDRGRTVESVLSQYEDTVRPMHLKFVEPTKKYASFILPNGGKDKAVQDMLINHITQFLNEVE